MESVAASCAFPYRLVGGSLVSFATGKELFEALGPLARFDPPQAVESLAFVVEGSETAGIASFDAANMVSDIVRRAWEKRMELWGLRYHTLASGAKAWFFANGALEKNRGYYVGADKKRHFRQLVGQKTKYQNGARVADGYWHYAVSGFPQLHHRPRMALHHHVIFTDDGETPWQSAERMQKARRGACKNWWNAEWRDRLSAVTAQLGGESGLLALPLSPDSSAMLSMKSIQFTSPWSFYEDNERGQDESQDVILDEPEDDWDDQDGEADDDA